MSAQSSISLFGISDVDARNLSVLHEPNLLTRRYSERASRSQIRIQGVSGSTIYLAEVDPILTIDISGWMLTRGGLANAHPGSRIPWNVIENWRNGATRRRTDLEEKNGEYPAETQDHFGWDVAGEGASGYSFIVRDPTVTRTHAALSEVSIQLALECTASAGAGSSGGGTGLPATNPPDTVPAIGSVPRIVTVYTSAGTWQFITYLDHITNGDIFGSDVGPWDPAEGKRPISGTRSEYPDPDFVSSKANVRGINVQAVSGQGSGAGGEWLTDSGSAEEVIDSGLTLKTAGTNMFVFVNPPGDLPGRDTAYLVTGAYANSDGALASIGKTTSDFVGIWQRGAWVNDLVGTLGQADPLTWFSS